MISFVSKTGISKIFVKKKKAETYLGVAGCCCCCCCVMTMDVGDGGSRFNRPSAVAETGLDTKWWRRQKRFFFKWPAVAQKKNGFGYERRRRRQKRFWIRTTTNLRAETRHTRSLVVGDKLPWLGVSADGRGGATKTRAPTAAARFTGFYRHGQSLMCVGHAMSQRRRAAPGRRPQAGKYSITRKIIRENVWKWRTYIRGGRPGPKVWKYREALENSADLRRYSSEIQNLRIREKRNIFHNPQINIDTFHRPTVNA